MNESLPITEEDVKSMQKSWAQSVEGKDVTSLLYLYDSVSFLKPTLSNSIRKNQEQKQWYFTGNSTTEDEGFLNLDIQQVVFVDSNVAILGQSAIDVGTYKFIMKDQTEVYAHYTFGYSRNEKGHIKIKAHHSSKYL